MAESDYRTIDQLHRDLRACRRCAEAGHAIFSEPVFSGSQEARLMLIGQAPGQAEGWLPGQVDPPANRPFSGDAGARLFRWMARAGWTEEEFRARCYITSVTKCFPGKAASGNGDRVPSAAERRLCRPWLDWELKLVAPEVIVPVGSVAASLFFPGGVKLVELIGQHFTDAEGRHLVPLPHPSGTSRWHSDPRNVGRIEEALDHLRILKHDLGL